MLTSILDALGVGMIVAGMGVIFGTGAALLTGGVLLVGISYNLTRGGKP